MYPVRWMTISLDETRQRLAIRLAIVNGGFERLLVARSSGFRIDRFALQEGLVSQLWQAWGIFCRQTIMVSAVGGVTASGQMTTSRFAGLSESQIAFC